MRTEVQMNSIQPFPRPDKARAVAHYQELARQAQALADAARAAALKAIEGARQ